MTFGSKVTVIVDGPHCSSYGCGKHFPKNAWFLNVKVWQSWPIRNRKKSLEDGKLRIKVEGKDESSQQSSFFQSVEVPDLEGIVKWAWIGSWTDWRHNTWNIPGTGAPRWYQRYEDAPTPPSVQVKGSGRKCPLASTLLPQFTLLQLSTNSSRSSSSWFDWRTSSWKIRCPNRKFNFAANGRAIAVRWLALLRSLQTRNKGEVLGFTSLVQQRQTCFNHHWDEMVEEMLKTIHITNLLRSDVKFMDVIGLAETHYLRIIFLSTKFSKVMYRQTSEELMPKNWAFCLILFSEKCNA